MSVVSEDRLATMTGLCACAWAGMGEGVACTCCGAAPNEPCRHCSPWEEPDETSRVVDLMEAQADSDPDPRLRDVLVEYVHALRGALERRAAPANGGGAKLPSGEEVVGAERAAKDGAYRERDQVIALAARMALALGWRAGLRAHEPDPDPTWDDEWRNVVLIDLPTGQCSWHYPDAERPLFQGLPPYPDAWDGHDTTEKYRRVATALGPPKEDAHHG